MSIGSRIKEARERKKIKQVELAGMLDTHPITLSRWERDINTPDGNILKKIAEKLSVTVAYLSGESKIPDISKTENIKPEQSSETPKKIETHTEYKKDLYYKFPNGAEVSLPASPEYVALFEKLITQGLDAQNKKLIN